MVSPAPTAPPGAARRGAEAPHDPLAASSLGALRLLAGFALWAEETAPGRTALLEVAGATGARACQAPFRLLAALRRSPAARGSLDGMLAMCLARRAAPYAGKRPAEVAALWRARRAELAGPDLAALLWHVARSPGLGFRLLEAAVVGESSDARLLRGDVPAPE